MHSSPLPASPYNWSLIYPDGRQISNEECHWSEVSVLRGWGTEHLYLTKEPAAQLSTVVAGRSTILKAPDQDTRFFLYMRSRTSLAKGTQIHYFSVGYICDEGKVSI